ncbi:N-acetylmuramoyl-L-alanine amidase CwlD [Bacillus fonticola]|uniref:N-acetylmuramoyl-L-alanine amidase CwlD n=1 Tax=Bacillus fonticola TaxID=2728853 RepID=UPI0014759174|nr:N-acetylmuramoyl-L-alanine amidase CwlD [Bacillus fonticola]
MKQKLKWALFTLGAIVLFMIIQVQFNDDSSFEAWNLPLTGKVIYLDPGHGGVDPGANSDAALEKEIALNVSLKLRDYLQEQGALVLMTREEDKDLADEEMKGYSRRKVQDLQRRMNLINESTADLFLSIHLNSVPSSKWNGAQTFYSPKYAESQRAAEAIQNELIRNLENTTRQAKALGSVYLLRNAEKPGALVEIGFLSNQEERERLMTDGYQEKVAASMYEGILQHFTLEDEAQESPNEETSDE